MNYEEIAKTEKFRTLLEQLPEEERVKVEEVIKKMAAEFNEKVLVPLEKLVKR